MALLPPVKNGRMFPGWHRWNILGGCYHGCSYCYMRGMQERFKKDFMTSVFHEEMLKDNLGSGKKIFCCSSGDAWGSWVKWQWIDDMLAHCAEYPVNEYMFLTKNPQRYMTFDALNDLDCILGITIETDLNSGYSAYVPVEDRLLEAGIIRNWFEDLKTMIVIEPVMKFSVEFVDKLRVIKPDIVYVGVDSGSNGLPEPHADELARLIIAVGEFTEVHLKKGIERILGGNYEVVK